MRRRKEQMKGQGTSRLKQLKKGRFVASSETDKQLKSNKEASEYSMIQQVEEVHGKVHKEIMPLND